MARKRSNPADRRAENEPAPSATLPSLRERAESAWRGLRRDIGALSGDEIRRVVHELEVHQIELEMQNEELRHAQNELAESRDRLCDLYDFAPVGYLTLGHDAIIVEANLTAAALLGIERNKLIDKKFSHFIAPDAQDTFYLHQRSALPGTPKQSCELRLRKADGADFTAQMETVCFKEPATGALSWRSTISDISDRKRLEQELEMRLAELQAADRRKDEYLATLGHELRNPLAVINNYISLLQRKALGDPTVQRSLVVMERQIRQLRHLIDDLLDLSRIDRDKLALRKARVAFADIVTAAVESSQPVIDSQGHKLTVTLPEAPVYLDGDTVRLTQVFMNLLTNAAKYTPPGGRIALMAGLDGANLIVRVTDNGIGIAADKLPHLFEIFFQADGSHQHVEGGLGLGLTLVKRLVEMHGGTVQAHSAGLNQGSEFVISLPVAL